MATPELSVVTKASVSRNEVGATGLIWAQGGVISEEVNPNLAGSKAIQVYKEMSDNDPVVSAIMFVIDMLIRQVEWPVEQGEATEQDVEFLESCMKDMSHSWADFISEILSMLPYGFSIHETVYKVRRGYQKEGSKLSTSGYSDGKIGWARLPIRSQDSLDHWEFDDDGQVTAFVQNAPPKYEIKPIPMAKLILFRTRTFKNNPEGRSLLRGAYRPWFFKKRIEEIEGVGIERDLAGFPRFRVPAEWLSDEATDDQKAIIAEIKRIGANIRRDKQEFLIWPSLFDENGNDMFGFDLIASAGTRTFDTDKIISRYDQRIAMSVLADFILLGHEKVGSFALSSDKTDIFAVALGTILSVIAETLNRFAVPRLWEMNNMDPTKCPKITHGDIEDQDLAVLGQFLTVLNGMGVRLFPDEELENHLRKLAHIPEKSEEAKQRQEEEDLQQQEQGLGDEGEIRFTDDDGGAVNPGQGGGGNGQPPPGA